MPSVREELRPSMTQRQHAAAARRRPHDGGWRHRAAGGRDPHDRAGAVSDKDDVAAPRAAGVIRDGRHDRGAVAAQADCLEPSFGKKPDRVTV